MEFCNKLSQREGLEPCYTINGTDVTCDFTKNGYRLPTEAEWEYAARGGKKSHGYKFSGSNSFDDVAWFIDNSGDETHDVGTKQPNELGIYDMNGNVWEWCWDWFASDYYSSSPQDNPRGPDSGFHRVVRGGSCHNYAYRLISLSHRGDLNPDHTDYIFGFRILRAKK